MKILIIGTSRSGTTSLIKGLGRYFNYKKFGEPFNLSIYRDKQRISWPYHFPDDCVVKTLSDQYPVGYKGTCIEFIQELSIQFDTVILLGRKSKEDILISYTYFGDKPSGEWHSPYYPDIESLDLTKYKKLVDNQVVNLSILSKKLDKKITWYEDLYSGNKHIVDTLIENWGLKIDYSEFSTYINPSNRYRGRKKQLL